MNEDTIKGKWLEIKGDIQKSWGRLTEDEIEKAKGSLHSLAGVIQQKYGLAKEAVNEKLHQLVEKYNDKVDSTADSIKKEPKDMI